MITATAVRPKTHDSYQAVQFNLNDAPPSELIQWIHDHGGMARWMCAGTEHPCENLEHWLEVLITDGTGWVKLELGDYVVLFGDGEFEVLTPAQYDEKYEPVLLQEVLPEPEEEPAE